MKYIIAIIVVVLAVWIILTLTKPSWVTEDDDPEVIDNAKMLLWVAVISALVLVVLYLLNRMNNGSWPW